MIWVAIAAVPFVAIYLLDRQARHRAWRLGRWTQRLGTRSTIWVRGERYDVQGWCENCQTSWRYALPHVTLTRRDVGGPATLYAILCQKCRRELSMDVVIRRYAEWWVAKNEHMIEQGLTPDPREFDDLKAQVRVGG